VKFGDLKESKMTYFIVLGSIRICVLQNRAVQFAEGCTLLEPWSTKKCLYSKMNLLRKHWRIMWN